MALKPITISNFKGGLNLSTTSDIGDNQFQIATNVYYNQKGQIQTRYGYTTFGNAVGTGKPITSYFFFQRDDTGATTALCSSGTDMYKYNETTGNWASIKSGLTEFETATGRTTERTRRDFAVYKNIIYMCNGVDAYASYNGTTYTTYASQPKYRYVNMNTDRLFGAGEDLNPSTIYYTAAAPADGSALDANAVVVGGDELGRINGMNELGNIILALKSSKVYSIDVTNTKADAIDAQTGGFSDRSIANVGNSLVYLTDRGVDTLQPRSGVSGSSALETKPLDTDVRELTTDIDEKQLNSNCGWYIKRLGNYYISFDTNADNIPDTTLVYNSMVKAWTRYNYPNTYDYGFYINSDGEYKYLIASATTDQMYEIETGFTDNGTPVSWDLKSKNFDFGEPGTFKTYGYIDIIGQKEKYKTIDIEIEVDGVVVGGGQITDSNITETATRETLGVRPIGVDTLTGSGTEGLTVYQFVARVPLYVTGSYINFRLKSSDCVMVLHKARIDVNAESVDVFGYNNII